MKNDFFLTYWRCSLLKCCIELVEYAIIQCIIYIQQFEAKVQAECCTHVCLFKFASFKDALQNATVLYDTKNTKKKLFKTLIEYLSYFKFNVTIITQVDKVICITCTSSRMVESRPFYIWIYTICTTYYTMYVVYTIKYLYQPKRFLNDFNLKTYVSLDLSVW